MKQATTSPMRDRKIGHQSQYWQWKLNTAKIVRTFPSRPYPTIEPRTEVT